MQLKFSRSAGCVGRVRLSDRKIHVLLTWGETDPKEAARHPSSADFVEIAVY